MSCYKSYSLPDIEMYGGDTTPWEIFMVYEDGTNFTVGSGTQCTCSLTLSPFVIKSTLSNGGSSVPKIWTHQGTIRRDAELGTLSAVFDFVPEDTINLRGKFVYQVDVSFGDDIRVCQGILNIKQNVRT